MSRSPKQTKISETLPIGTDARQQMNALLKPRATHGGPPSRGKRKTKRPFYTTTPLHFVLSSKRAKGIWSLSHRRHASRITGQIYTYAKRFKVRIYQARVEGQRIHVLLKASDRKALADFLRVLAGRVAVGVSGAKRGVKKVGKFWDELCWSRLVNWGHDFFQVRKLILVDPQFLRSPESPDFGIQAELVPLIPGS